MAEAPLVSIIVLNRNGNQFLETCLSSLLQQSYPSYEIILVDNASTDDSVAFVCREFPSVKIIQNDTNLGFVANNQGIQAAKGEYIALINNDTRADEHWLQNMVMVAERDQYIGMCAPKILSMKDPNIIDSVGGLLIYPDGMSRGRGRLEEDVGQYDHAEEILLPSGCAVLYRKAMLDEIGLFDEHFFAYCEDTDLGLRGRLGGWKAVATPEAIVYHHYSGYGGRYSALKAFLVERNHFWVVVKNFPLCSLWKLPFYTGWRYLLQVYAALFGRGSAGNFERSKLVLVFTLLKAYGSGLWSLPRMLKKRKAIQSARRVSCDEVRRWFKRFRLSAVDLVLKE